MEHKEEQDDGGFALMLKELINLHEDASKSKDSNRSGFDLVLRELMTQREKAAVATERLKQQSELMAEREKTAAERLKLQEEVSLMLAKQQNDFQLHLQKQQEEFQSKLEKREERLQERLEQERREHNLKQDKLLARQDELNARHDQERVLEQGRQQTFFREVMQQLREEVKTLRHSESGKSKNCQGRVMLKQPGDANRFRSSFDSIHSWRSWDSSQTQDTGF